MLAGCKHSKTCQGKQHLLSRPRRYCQHPTFAAQLPVTMISLLNSTQTQLRTRLAAATMLAAAGTLCNARSTATRCNSNGYTEVLNNIGLVKIPYGSTQVAAHM
jgi:hypothetical protein